MDRETFLNYKRYLWLWISAAVLAVMWCVYAYTEPVGGKNGGTVVGYTYGGIATAGILYLMWYGIRKRSFNAKYTTLRGTLAAHIWIGIALVFMVPLHSGFSFGWNVHTLAYVLMLITIFSGIWGVVMYSKLPMHIYSQRGGGTLKQLLQQIRLLSGDINKLAGLQGPAQRSEPRSDKFLALLKEIDFSFEPSLLQSLRSNNPAPLERKQTAELLSTLPREEQEDGLKLIGLVNKKRELVCRVQNEAKTMAWVRIWLYLHLPISFGLLVALAIHIFSVFYYW